MDLLHLPPSSSIDRTPSPSSSSSSPSSALPLTAPLPALSSSSTRSSSWRTRANGSNGGNPLDSIWLPNVPAQAARARKRALALATTPITFTPPTRTSKRIRARKHPTSTLPVERPAAAPAPERVASVERTCLPYPFDLIEDAYDQEVQVLSELRGKLVEQLRRAQIEEHELVALFERVRDMDEHELLFSAVPFSDDLPELLMSSSFDFLTGGDSALAASLPDPSTIFQHVQPSSPYDQTLAKAGAHPRPPPGSPLAFAHADSRSALLSPSFTTLLNEMMGTRRMPQDRMLDDMYLDEPAFPAPSLGTSITDSSARLEELDDVLSSLASSYANTPVGTPNDRPMTVNDALRRRTYADTPTGSSNADLDYALDLESFLNDQADMGAAAIHTPASSYDAYSFEDLSLSASSTPLTTDLSPVTQHVWDAIDDAQ